MSYNFFHRGEFMRKLRQYIFNQSIKLSDRSFILFSVLVLIALTLAIPCGLFMHEPLIATISTAIGLVFFSLYVYFSYRFNKIERVKVALSVFVVFIFLPAMFFTNGGATSGTPIWLLLGTIYIALILDGVVKYVMLGLNFLVLTLCFVFGYYHPEYIDEYTVWGDYYDTLAAMFIVGGIVYTIITFQTSLYRQEEHFKNLQKLFGQTATALVNAIDAKDNYTHGHSSRVAEYSKRLAELAGKSPAECEEIYYVALLHDVGKIGVSEDIINKKGKLTDEEYEEIKKHTVWGAQILHSITEYPKLIIGAKFHHERYDGRGYPEHLKGEDIPEIARIISVADAYDAMTSKRSYRDPIPQVTVREEIIKGSGTQFDPKYAKLMQYMIDMDTDYEMKEKDTLQELAGRNDLFCGEYKETVSDGILIEKNIVKKIRMKCQPIDKSNGPYIPSIILFDSLDQRYHADPNELKESNFFEYAQFWFDGRHSNTNARKIVWDENDSSNRYTGVQAHDGCVYDIEFVRVRDHVQIKIDDMVKVVRYTVALPDSMRYAYIGLTGRNCHFYDVSITAREELVSDNYIMRIADEVTYLKGPEGDVPSIQINDYRASSTEGIPVRDGMKISFHSISLPTARLVWHCPYVDLFYSPSKLPSGEGYREYALIRLDGENWEAEEIAENTLLVDIQENFKGWEAWKAANKEGIDCTITFNRSGDTIVATTENLGIKLKCITKLHEEPEEVYVSLTGDQVALTDIRILA